VDFPNRNPFQCDFLKSPLNHLFKFWVFGAFSLAESEIGLSDFGFFFFFFLQVVFLSGSSNFLVVWVKEENKGGARERKKKL